MMEDHLPQLSPPIVHHSIAAHPNTLLIASFTLVAFVIYTLLVYEHRRSRHQAFFGGGTLIDTPPNALSESLAILTNPATTIIYESQSQLVGLSTPARHLSKARAELETRKACLGEASVKDDDEDEDGWWMPVGMGLNAVGREELHDVLKITLSGQKSYGAATPESPTSADPREVVLKPTPKKGRLRRLLGLKTKHPKSTISQVHHLQSGADPWPLAPVSPSDSGKRVSFGNKPPRKTLFSRLRPFAKPAPERATTPISSRPRRRDLSKKWVVVPGEAGAEDR